MALRPSLQWLRAVCSSAESQAGGAALGELFALLRGRGRQATDRTVPTLNRARALISKVFHFSAPGAGSSAAADPDGPQKARACLYLYQRALHRVLLTALRCAAAARGLPSPDDLSEAQRDWSVGSVVDQGEMLQLGLVHACIEVVNFVHLRSLEEAFPRLTLLLERVHMALELFQGVRWLGDMLGPLGSDGVPAMPVEVAAYLGQMEARVVEELAFLPGSTLYVYILALPHAQASGMEEASEDEEQFLEDGHFGAVLSGFLRAVARLAQVRCDALCDALADAERAAPALTDEPTTFAFAAAAASLLDWLLNRHLDVLFFQHLSVVVVSSLYFTAKVHGVEGVSMRSLTSLAAAILPCHVAATFSQVGLLPVQSAKAAGSDGTSGSDKEGEDASSDGSDDEGMAHMAIGTSRQFYNSVLLPVLEPHLKAPEDMFGLNHAELKAALAAAGTQGCAGQPAVHAEGGRQSQEAGAAKAEAGGRAKAAKRPPLGSHQPNTKRPLV